MLYNPMPERNEGRHRHLGLGDGPVQPFREEQPLGHPPPIHNLQHLLHSSGLHNTILSHRGQNRASALSSVPHNGPVVGPWPIQSVSEVRNRCDDVLHAYFVRGHGHALLNEELTDGPGVVGFHPKDAGSGGEQRGFRSQRSRSSLVRRYAYVLEDKGAMDEEERVGVGIKGGGDGFVECRICSGGKGRPNVDFGAGDGGLAQNSAEGLDVVEFVVGNGTSYSVVRPQFGAFAPNGRRSVA